MNATVTNIQIVDDETAVRKLLRKCFERESFGTYESENNQQKLEQLSSHRIDLITLDLTLGGENGLELARKIRATVRCPTKA